MIAAAMATAAVQARAQTVSIPGPTVDRGPGDVRQNNPSTLYYISHDDCVHNRAFGFDVSVSPSSLGFQVLATATGDCSTAAGRAASTGGPGGCSLVWTGDPTSGPVVVEAGDLVNRVLGVDCDGNPIAGSGPSSSSTSSSGSPVGVGAPGSVQVTLYFILNPYDTDPLSCSSMPATPGMCQTWSTQVELVPPAAPSGISLGNGGGELIVDVPPSSNVSASGGYYVFCNAVADASDGGSSSSGGDGGTGDAGASGACPVGAGFPGLDLAHPDPSSPYVCAVSAQPNTNGVHVWALGGDGGPLLDDATYIVAVAAYDDVFDVGPVSQPVCGSPQPTDTYLDHYCADQGAGCVDCGIRNVGEGGAPWPVLGVLALAATGVVARRDRRRRDRSGRPRMKRIPWRTRS